MQPIPANSPSTLVPVSKADFLAAIATDDVVMDSRHDRPDAAGDVADIFRLRNGDVRGHAIHNPRRPLSRPARYFLARSGDPLRTERSHHG